MSGTSTAHAHSPASRATAHGRWETRLLLRNGEQLLLTFAIPIGLLLALTLTTMFSATAGQSRVPNALATVLTVSVISSAFTSLAIATGFERRSGALRFMATTPLTRVELLAGKFGATAVVTVLSCLTVSVVALALGWRPTAATAWVPVLVVLGTAAFAAWGMALAGLLRAEAVLAVANGLFLILVMFGGVIIPSSSLPGAARDDRAMAAVRSPGRRAARLPGRPPRPLGRLDRRHGDLARSGDTRRRTDVPLVIG